MVCLQKVDIDEKPPLPYIHQIGRQLEVLTKRRLTV